MFIERAITIPGSGPECVLELHAIEQSDLNSLPEVPDENVTKYLTPFLAKLVENLCAGDSDSFETIARDPESAFWGIYSNDELLAITGLFAITTENDRETSARTFCGIFDPANFGKKIATKVMPVRSWYGLVERDIDMLTSYVAKDNPRSVSAVGNTGYIILGKAKVPETDMDAVKFFQFNPRLGLDKILELAQEEAANLGNTIDPVEVARCYDVTVAHLAKVQGMVDSSS